MSTRAKMTCVFIDGPNVKFECLYKSENKPEDNSFSKWTPYGKAEYNITNEDALKLFVPGKTYYFDITPCEE